MRVYAVLFVLKFFCLLPSALAQDKEGFELVKKEGGIAIYERWITLPTTNPPVKTRELKCEFYYNNGLYAGLHLLRNEKMIQQWQPQVSEFRIYHQRDTTVWLEYAHHAIPWPVSNQDHFMEYKLLVHTNRMLTISFKSRDNADLAPIRKGVTRLYLSGSWTLELVGNHRVKATYKVISKPGSIPKMLTDPIVRTNIISNMQGFVDLLEAK